MQPTEKELGYLPGFIDGEGALVSRSFLAADRKGGVGKPGP